MRSPPVAKAYNLYKTIICLAFTALLVPIVATIYGQGTLAWGIFVGLFLVLLCIAPARRFPTAESLAAGHDLKGKVVFITGPTSGIGEETARVLVKCGAHVIMAARSLTKLEASKAAIVKSMSGSLCEPEITLLECDLDELSSVASCATQFAQLDLPIDILILNAGIMADPVRRTTKNGLEQQMGVNHIGHFALTQKLLPHLQRAQAVRGAARVVVLSSSACQCHDPNYLHGLEKATKNASEYLPEGEYEGWASYGNAKVSNLLFAKEFHERYGKDGISAFSLNPGGIHTGLQGNVDFIVKTAWLIVTPFIFKSIKQGAATTIHCALIAPSAEGGMWFDNCKATENAEKMSASVSGAVQKWKGEGMSAQQVLWEQSETIVARLMTE